MMRSLNALKNDFLYMTKKSKKLQNQLDKFSAGIQNNKKKEKMHRKKK